jgi:dephospho-CoA kinase
MTSTVIAVTGEVGAGKSTASKIFESLGGVRIDADRVVAELWRTQEIVAAAVKRWGARVLDDSGKSGSEPGERGPISHKAVAGIVFGDRAEYDWVTGLLHPRVMEEIERRLGLLGDRCAVAEIPMLFESGGAPWATARVFVTAPREIRLERCRARGWDEIGMTRRESFFLPAEERIARSDYVIRNDGGLGKLEEAVRAIYSDIGLRGGDRSMLAQNAGAPEP